ncbi:MAG: NAD(P)-binding protein [Oscillospiraceae bacterium]|nr:NAD(P)-binding protein [Oscillospiraceae bacterium]
MKTHEYETFADRCFRDTPPPCACVCPLPYDVREFIKLMQRGSYRSALRLYRSAVIFPDIVSRLCPAPCEGACVRGRMNGDRSIDLKALERVCVERGTSAKPERFNIPKRLQSVAVIGAGLSGLACAYKLASAGYGVTVYEKSSSIGGSVLSELPQSCAQALEREFSAVDCSFTLNTEITGLDQIAADGVYIATGKGGNAFLPEEGSYPGGVFSGGRLLGADHMSAIAHGIRAAQALELYFKVGRTAPISTRDEKEPDDRYYAIPYRIPEASAPPAKGEPEAHRCLRCNCTACYDVCPMMEKRKIFPKKMSSDVVVTLKPNMSKRTGVRMITGCTFCGKCQEVCPENINMGECLLEARGDFYESGAMAPAFHDYLLRDMDFTLSDEAYLVYRRDESLPCQAVFFPGCQLGASLPEYVTSVFECFERVYESPALYLGCCGAPSVWAGQRDKTAQAGALIQAQWERLGRPVFISACPSCVKNLKKLCPEIPVRSLYVWLTEHEDILPTHTDGATVHVLDPCASYGDTETAEAVRSLLRARGYTVENPAQDVGCCGFGGHIYASDPELYHEFARRRISGQEGVFAVYCANCRDVFVHDGADARHILDFIFGCSVPMRQPPELGQRRENRRRLKAHYLGHHVPPEESPLQVVIPPSVVEKMDSLLILRQDVQNVILAAEESRRKIYDQAQDVYYAHRRIGAVTIWARYRLVDEGAHVENVYCHRVDVKEG